MATESRGSSGGPGLCTLLTVLFVGLRLTGYIDWPWWQVLAPLWIALGFWLLLIIAAVVAALSDRP